MSFAELRLELPENYGAVYSIVYSGGFNNIIGAYDPIDSYGRQKSIVIIELGDREVTEAQLTMLTDFYNARNGIAQGFRLRNWLDYTLNNEPIAYGIAQAQVVQLTKTYTAGLSSVSKPIIKPVVGDITILSDNVVLTTGWTLDYTTGVLSLDNTVTSYISVTGSYDLPVSFETPSLTSTFLRYDSVLDQNIYYLNSLVASEIPYEPQADYYPSNNATSIDGVLIPTSTLQQGSFEFAQVGGLAQPKPGVHEVGAASVYELGLPLQTPELLEVGSVTAAATVAATLLELRRMMPFGMKWFSLEAVDNMASIIGSMLFAEADMYFSWSLSLYTIEKQRSPLSVKFEYAQQWFELLFGRAVVASDGFLRRLMELYILFDNQDAASYVNYLNEFYNIESTLGYPEVPAFSVYDLSNPSEDLNYTLATNNLDLAATNGQLTETEFYSVMFKLEAGQWVDRAVPGFPIPPDQAPADSVVVDASTYLQNPQDNVLVIDGPMLIYPLRNFLMRLEVDLGDNLPPNLNGQTDNLMPAGLLINYKANSIHIGDW